MNWIALLIVSVLFLAPLWLLFSRQGGWLRRLGVESRHSLNIMFVTGESCASLARKLRRFLGAPCSMHSSKVKCLTSNSYTNNQYLDIFYLFFATQCKSSDAHWLLKKDMQLLKICTTLKIHMTFEKAHSSILAPSLLFVFLLLLRSF